MSTAAEFRIQLQQWARETLPEAIGEFRNDIARTAHRVVIEATPTLTGNTRGNVHLTVGPEPTGEYDATARDPSGQAALSAGEAALAASMDPYEPAWIVGDSFLFRILNNGGAKGKPRSHVTIGRHMLEQAVVVVEQQFGGDVRVVGGGR